MQFLVHLKLAGKPRNVTGTSATGIEYSFWTVDGQAVQFGAGSLGVGHLAGTIIPEDGGPSPVPGLDIGALDYFGAVYFGPDDGEVTKESERVIKALRSANGSDTLKLAVRLGTRFGKSASGTRIQQIQFIIVKAAILERGVGSDDLDIPF